MPSLTRESSVTPISSPTQFRTPPPISQSSTPYRYHTTPTVRAAAYSGVPVHELQVRGVPVMRRVSDSWINATQILRAAGLPKPQRTKILDRDVTRGTHEKVQGGYAGFQGTWVPLDNARDLARQFGVAKECEVLFSFSMDRDYAEPARKKRKMFMKREKDVFLHTPPELMVHTPPPLYPDLIKEKLRELEREAGTDSDVDTDRDSETEAEMERKIRFEMERKRILERERERRKERERERLMEEKQKVMKRKVVVEQDAESDVDVEEDDDNGPQIAAPQPTRPIRMSLRTASSIRPLKYPGASSPSSTPPSQQPQPSTTQNRPTRVVFTTTPPNSQPTTRTATPTTRTTSPAKRKPTPPLAGQRCEVCGVTSTPQWRRGPSGKRSLCNACGVKYSFGRLNDQNRTTPTPKQSDDSQSDSESVTPKPRTKALTLPTSPTTFTTPSSYPTTLETDLKHLQTRLRTSQQSISSLHSVLENTVIQDNDIDRTYRHIIQQCRRRASVFSEGEYESEEEDEQDEDEEQEEERVLRAFLGAVWRRGREREEVVRGFCG